MVFNSGNVYLLGIYKQSFKNDKGETVDFTRGEFMEPGDHALQIPIAKDANIEVEDSMTLCVLDIELVPNQHGVKPRVVGIRMA